MTEHSEIVAHAEAPAPVADPWFAMVERAALNPAIDPDKLVKLYDLAERAQAARAKAAFASDFALMQANLPRIDRRGRIVVYSKAARDRPGGPTSDDVPQQITPYARLEDIVSAIAPALSAHGFSISHRTERTSEGMINVVCVLLHRDGHSAQTSFPFPHDSTGSKNSVQAVGSSITYGRRYTILSLLNIVSHAPQDADDDARKADEAGAASSEQVAEIESLIEETDSETTGLLKYAGATSIESMTAKQAEKALAGLRAKKKKGDAR